jgi:hypothetical protein
MNKDIMLTGIGNALIDLEFEIKDEILTDLNYPKGNMTLVSSEEQASVFDKLGTNTNFKCSGGSAANTIIAFSGFGGKAAYKTKLGNDELGKFYASEFEEMGILLDAPTSDLAPTGTCCVLITEDSERTLLTNLGATSLFGKQHIKEETIKRSHWIYLEGYKLTDESGRDALYHAISIAKANDTKISFTFSDKFIIDVFGEGLQEVFNASDLIFCNEQEAKAFTKKDSVQEAIDSLFSYSKDVVITLGADGAVVKSNGEIYNIPSYPTKAVDTTGAGDMFAGGFLYGMIYWDNVLKAGHLASLASSRVVSSLGARLKESHIELRDKIANMNL